MSDRNPQNPEFACGEVVGFVSREIDGGYSKFKYHVCVSVEPLYFFFISTSGSRDGIMTIFPDDWPRMTKKSSFISYRKIVSYTDMKLQNTRIRRKGRLSNVALGKLMETVRRDYEEHEVLSKAQMQAITSAIKAVLGTNGNDGGYYAGSR